MNNLTARIISSVILAIIVSVIVIFTLKIYYCFIALIGILMFYEWWKMSKNTVYLKYSIILFIPILSLIFSRYYGDYKLILLYVFSIASTDTFAMVGGKLIGGKKLAPVISPNKTWSGLFCGMLASSLACWFLGNAIDIQLSADFILYGLINAVVAQYSDLFVSYFKRKCNVKDSGTLIPGHGGVLDRFDGFIFSAPLLLALILWQK